MAQALAESKNWSSMNLLSVNLDSILTAIEKVLESGDPAILTGDLKGKGTTKKLGDAIVAALD